MLLRRQAAFLHRRHCWRRVLRVAAIHTSPSAESNAPCSVGFSADIGVTDKLREAGYINDATRFAGASAGSLIAASACCGIDTAVLQEGLSTMAADLRQNGTRGRLRVVLARLLDERLPPDAHERCSGRLTVAITRLGGGEGMLRALLMGSTRNGVMLTSVDPSSTVDGAPQYTSAPLVDGLLVSEFTSRDDLISALLTSCHIPIWFDGKPTTKFRGDVALDGGLTNFLPDAPGCDTSIRVCCFPAAQAAAAARLQRIDIAPDAGEVPGPSKGPWHAIRLIQWALTPASDQDLAELMVAGQTDASRWIDAQLSGGGRGGGSGEGLLLRAPAEEGAQAPAVAEGAR